MMRKIVEEALWRHIENPNNLEGLAITIFHKDKVFGVDIDPGATKALLEIDFDAPEGEGIPAHNFIQQYLVPAIVHLQQMALGK